MRGQEEIGKRERDRERGEREERERGERKERGEKEGENVCMCVCEREVRNMMVHEHQVRTNWESKSG